MTDTPKPPERMTDEDFRWVDNPMSEFYLEDMAAFGRQYDLLRTEARRARSEESRLQRHAEAGWTLAEAFAREFGRALERWAGYRESAVRLRDVLKVELGTSRMLWRERLTAEAERDEARAQVAVLSKEIGAIGTSSLQSLGKAQAMMAERDAARKEAERLRGALERIRDQRGPFAIRGIAEDALKVEADHE